LHDGQLDIDERRQIIRALIPQLGQEAKRLNETGEYTSASFLWQNLKFLKARGRGGACITQGALH